ncbi:MAG: GDYXXLXY domain-containing protein [Bryobacterales bacterium]|nr:GDYXXLXY domain-containing protein [Bryobacterales bacterium]
MTSAMRKGALVGAFQVLLVLSVSGKYLYDRATLPRVWVKTAPVDPHLPIRGRYLSLGIEVEAPPGADLGGLARLSVENGKLAAHRSTDAKGVRVWLLGSGGRYRLVDPLAFFLPPDVPDPSRLQPGEELWMEVSVPGNGPPRPVRLGIRKGTVLRPLEFH